MNKYKVGDKVIVRKDLIVDEFYDGLYWSEGKEYLKVKDYVVIEEVDIVGDYWIEDGHFISDEMIAGLYMDNGVNIKPDYEDKYSDPTLVEIITDFLDRLENAYDNKKFIPITTMHLLVLQRLLNDAGFDYKFKAISKINTK